MLQTGISGHENICPLVPGTWCYQNARVRLVNKLQVLCANLECVDEPRPHELIAKVQPEVEVVGRGDDGVDELHAGDLHGRVVHREALYNGRKAILSPDLPTDSDSLQSLLVSEITVNVQGTFMISTERAHFFF